MSSSRADSVGNKGDASQYEDCRDRIQDGDILMFGGTGLLSRIIKRVTDSRFSHVGIAMWWNLGPGTERRLMVLQAVGRGVEATPASKQVDRYSGTVEWFAIDPEVRRKHFDVQKFFDGAASHFGKSFSNVGMAKWLWHKFAHSTIYLGRPCRHADHLSVPSSMFCSWYVSLTYREHLVDLGCEPDFFASPDDIAKSKLLVRQCALERSAASRGKPGYHQKGAELATALAASQG